MSWTHAGRFYVLAAAVGVSTGLVCAAFRLAVACVARGHTTLVHLPGLPMPSWLVAAALGAVMLVAVTALVRGLAPEGGGSGIHEVEAHLDGAHPMRWRRVLPVKFVGGALALGSGLAVGPEGPAVHMGAALARMIGERTRCSSEHGRALVCAGAAAGLAAIFAAPVAGFLFVLEQMRRHFPLTMVGLHGLMLASASAAVVTAVLFGQRPAFPTPAYDSPVTLDLLLFAGLGAGIGAVGAVFDRALLATLRAVEGLRHRRPYLVPALIGGAGVGVVSVLLPGAVGSGEALTLQLFAQPMPWPMLALLLVVRLPTTIGSYAAEAPGGIFAPMLAIAALAGMLFGHAAAAVLPGLLAEPGIYALAAMGALFAASFRIPLTAIVLVLEITRSGNVTLAVTVSCIAASLTAQAMGTQPLYEVLLRRLTGMPPPGPRR